MLLPPLRLHGGSANRAFEVAVVRAGEEVHAAGRATVEHSTLGNQLDLGAVFLGEPDKMMVTGVLEGVDARRQDGRNGQFVVAHTGHFLVGHCAPFNKVP